MYRLRESKASCFPSGLVCSFQRASPINQDIIQEGAGEADPRKGSQRVWHFASLLLSIHSEKCGEILHSRSCHVFPGLWRKVPLCFGKGAKKQMKI